MSSLISSSSRYEKIRTPASVSRWTAVSVRLFFGVVAEEGDYPRCPMRFYVQALKSVTFREKSQNKFDVWTRQEEEKRMRFGPLASIFSTTIQSIHRVQ